MNCSFQVISSTLSIDPPTFTTNNKLAAYVLFGCCVSVACLLFIRCVFAACNPNPNPTPNPNPPDIPELPAAIPELPEVPELPELQEIPRFLETLEIPEAVRILGDSGDSGSRSNPSPFESVPWCFLCFPKSFRCQACFATQP